MVDIDSLIVDYKSGNITGKDLKDLETNDPLEETIVIDKNTPKEKECKEPKSSKLEYAICFICKKEGHIAKDCVDNPNGLYPNGGSCHLCQLKTHFSKDCPNKKQMKDNSKRQGITPKLVTPIDPNANDDAVFDVPLYEHELEEVTNTPKKRKFNERNKYYAKPNKK
eukprot:gene16838-22323_t